MHCGASYLLLAGIEAVLDDIKGRKELNVDSAEIMDSMVDDMEIIIFIGFLDVFFEFLETHEGPLVKFFHFGKRNLHGFSVEIRRIAQDVADGVADLAVHFGNVFDDSLETRIIALL